MIGTLHRLDHTGDTKTTWDPDNEDEVAAAEKVFKELRSKGYIAYVVAKGGDASGTLLNRFDPTVGKMILSPAPAGG